MKVTERLIRGCALLGKCRNLARSKTQADGGGGGGGGGGSGQKWGNLFVNNSLLIFF